MYFAKKSINKKAFFNPPDSFSHPFDDFLRLYGCMLVSIRELLCLVLVLVALSPQVSFAAPIPGDIDFGNDTTLCEGETLFLDASWPGATYLWQDGSTEATYIVTSPGTYSVSVTHNAVTKSDTIVVNYQALPVINLGSDQILCEGQFVQLDATQANGTYVWNDSLTNPTRSITSSGTYWVEATTNGCSSRDTISVTFDPLPVVELGDDTLICNLEALILDVTERNTTYQWQDGSPLGYYIVSTTGNYSVTATNKCGTTSDNVFVEVKECHCRLYVANSFSPNGDGINETFSPEHSCDFIKYRFRIYNRRGDVLLDTRDINAKWDGTFDGREVQLGSYVWRVTAEAWEETGPINIDRFGVVSLIRRTY